MQDGAFVLELDLERRHMSRADRAHGGVLFSLLDTALGRAVIEELPPGRGCATVELKINYFRPVQHGTIRTSGRFCSERRSLAYRKATSSTPRANSWRARLRMISLTDTIRQPERERV